MTVTTTDHEPRVWGDVEELLDVGHEMAVDVAVHDSSRLEWTAVLPASEARRYRLAFELDVPANLFPTHAPWAQMQSLARFERPHHRCDHTDPVARLREQALITTSRLAAARDGFARHVRRIGAAADDVERDALQIWLQAGLEAMERARAELAAQSEPTTTRERGFVDEYLSTQLLAMLTSMARALGDADRRIESQVVDALIAEGDHRRARGYVSSEETSAEGLERYVERAGLLKKRFGAMLHLRRESTPIEERIRPWVTALSAASAGAVAFALQLWFGTGRSAVGRQVGWGFVVLLMMVALTYGTKERLQIAGVHWLSRGLGRWYARRATKLYTTAGALALTARESFDEQALDPGDGDTTAAVPAVRIRFVHEGQLRAAAAQGQLRLIFRYDLSPLFPRLHDPVKAVGVVDRETNRVQFLDAPRIYRFAVRSALSSDGIERALAGTAVLDKFGLQRIEPAVPHPD